MIPITLIQEAPTRFVARTIRLGPGEFVTLPATQPLGRHRKAVIITNEDVNTRAYIVAGPAQGVDPRTLSVRLMPIRVDATVELPTSDEITIKNVSGSEEVDPLHIVEIFYR